LKQSLLRLFQFFTCAREAERVMCDDEAFRFYREGSADNNSSGWASPYPYAP